MKYTITEALADLKTIGKRIEKKRQFIGEHLLRPSITKDPLEKDGGTPEVLRRELQAVVDLERRHVSIRMAIQQANQITPVTIGDTTRMLSEWLTWRKEIAPARQNFIGAMRRAIVSNRTEWQKKVAANQNDPALSAGVEIHVDEQALAKEAEWFEQTLGQLDGQLSLKNATVLIEIAD